MSNESERKSRNRSECITLLDKSARDVLDYLYITNERNHTAIKNEVEDIARKLIQAFNETLQNNSWIGNTTREAFEKVLKVPLEIGYPDALLNMSVLEAFYKYVPYLPSNISFTEAFYYFQENLYKMKLRKFRHPEESNWRSVHSPRKGRSKFHEKFGIDIEIPYPIFVSPFFQRGLPRSLNYGAIGVTIARELGSTFSIDGNISASSFFLCCNEYDTTS
ncbi:neprilysin-1-like isoform X1 [Dermacentor silvarum]|uniref:neprilysin-1-like isoform X1 n=1 Tax=Dermacentor silvarum TaxID=543639 RepID=UPI0021007798|nr:neprilysin-1-like isoform X1 [Dermacentor silvarum]